MTRKTLSGGCLAAALMACSAVAGAGEVSVGNSILFNDADEFALKRAILDYERMRVTGSSVEEAVATPDSPNIFVSALAYYGEGQWTVWANGYRVTPGHQAPGFTVVAVSEETAEIAVGGGKPAHFALRPYQTWRSRTNDVVEGIFP